MWRVEDPRDDPDALGEAIEELERQGFKVECDALAGQMRLRERDGFLVQGLDLMSGTRWGRCTALATEIQKFESIIWPRIRDRETPPEGCSMLRSLLFRARRLGPLPTTARQLRNIIAKCGGRGDFAETPL